MEYWVRTSDLRDPRVPGIRQGRECRWGICGTPPGGDHSRCVEVSATYDTSISPHKSGEDVLYLMRDSKDPDGPKLAFTTSEWDAFIKGVKDGEFDLNS